MLVRLHDFWLPAVLLLPILSARHIPVKVNEINFPSDDNVVQIPGTRYLRQNGDPVNHSPQQQTSNFWNLLHTHGLGISATLGGGIRVASSDNHDTNDPNNTPKPSTNSVWDRYLGSTWHVGLNTHLGNNKQGQEGAAQHAHGGALPIISQPDDENKQLIEIELTSTPQPNSFWDRLNKYLSCGRWQEHNCDSNNNEENCDNSTNNIFTRIFTRLFLGEKSPEWLNNTENENRTIINRIHRYYDVSWMNSGAEGRRNYNLNQNFEIFRNTIRQFFVDKFAAYVTQDTRDNQLLQTQLKKSMGRILGDAESTSNSITDATLLQSLSKYFSDTKIRALFPIMEYVRTDLLNHTISTEEDYNKWFREYFASTVVKYYLSDQATFTNN